jgi:hypothetical protein
VSTQQNRRASVNPFDQVKSLPKPVIVGGIAITAGGSGIYLFIHHKKTGSWFGSSTASTASTAGSAIDPVTGLPTSQDNVIDPLTNMTYLAEATEYGSVTTAEASVSAYGQGSTATAAYPASTPAAGSVGSPTYTSDAAWAQAVQAGLSDISGSSDYDGTDIGTALGAYLTMTPLTADQAKLIGVAIAEYGYPPSGQIQIITVPVTSPSSTPVPGATPKPAQPTGVKSSAVSTTAIKVTWNAVSGATSYTVRVTYQDALVGSQHSTTSTSITVSGLSANRTYTAHVAASNSSGTSSETNGPAVKTKA